MDEQDFKIRLIGIRLSNFQDEMHIEERSQQAKIDDLFKRKQDNLAKVSNPRKIIYCTNDANESSKPDIYHLDDQSIGDYDDIDYQMNDLDLAVSSDTNDDQSNNPQSDEQENSTNELDYLCPVCSIRRFSQLDLLNEHVDYCLSRETIMSSVKEFNSNDSLIAEQINKKEQESSAKKRNRSSSSASKVPEDKQWSKRKKITEYFNKKASD